MAVFFDTGGGDIYAGPTKEDVIAAMKDDSSELDETQIEEVSGNTEMSLTDENDVLTGEKITLAEEYGDDTESYCICTHNC